MGSHGSRDVTMMRKAWRSRTEEEEDEEEGVKYVQEKKKTKKYKKSCGYTLGLLKHDTESGEKVRRYECKKAKKARRMGSFRPGEECETSLTLTGLEREKSSQPQKSKTVAKW